MANQDNLKKLKEQGWNDMEILLDEKLPVLKIQTYPWLIAASVLTIVCASYILFYNKENPTTSLSDNEIMSSLPTKDSENEIISTDDQLSEKQSIESNNDSNNSIARLPKSVIDSKTKISGTNVETEQTKSASNITLSENNLNHSISKNKEESSSSQIDKNSTSKFSDDQSRDSNQKIEGLPIASNPTQTANSQQQKEQSSQLNNSIDKPTLASGSVLNPTSELISDQTSQLNKRIERLVIDSSPVFYSNNDTYLSSKQLLDHPKKHQKINYFVQLNNQASLKDSYHYLHLSPGLQWNQKRWSLFVAAGIQFSLPSETRINNANHQLYNQLNASQDQNYEFTNAPIQGANSQDSINSTSYQNISLKTGLHLATGLSYQMSPAWSIDWTIGNYWLTYDQQLITEEPNIKRTVSTFGGRQSSILYSSLKLGFKISPHFKVQLGSSFSNLRKTNTASWQIASGLIYTL